MFFLCKLKAMFIFIYVNLTKSYGYVMFFFMDRLNLVNQPHPLSLRVNKTFVNIHSNVFGYLNRCLLTPNQRKANTEI